MVYLRRGLEERCARSIGPLTLPARGLRMSAIADLTCAEMTLAYRRGGLSPVEVARDVFIRIERCAAFNAFVAVDAEGALVAATQSEARWRAGAPLGPLDGVPATIKDNIW